MSKVLFSMLPAEYYLERTQIMQVRDYNQPMVIEKVSKIIIGMK